MTFHRWAAIAWKEVLQIVRDGRSVGIVVAMPIIMMLAFGYGISFDLKHLPVYVFDREGSQESQDLLKHFQASEYFNVVRTVNDYSTIVRALDGGRCKLALVVPYDFSQRLNEGRPVSIQALIDATDGNSANLAIAYSEAVILSYSQQVRLDWTLRRGQIGTQAPVGERRRKDMVQREYLESAANIVPGVVVIVMAVVGTFLTALTVAREWERGTMEQLIATPVTALELMLGKLAPCFHRGARHLLVRSLRHPVVRCALPRRLERLLCELHPFSDSGSIPGIFYFRCGKVTARGEPGFAPGYVPSGVPPFRVSLSYRPDARRGPATTYIMPARYYMAIIRNVFLKGSAVALLRNELFALAFLSCLLVFIATRVFKKKLN